MNTICSVCFGKVDRYSPNKEQCSVQCLTESRRKNAKGSNLNDLSKKQVQAEKSIRGL